MRYRFRSVRARFLAGIFLVSLLGVGALAIDHDRYVSRLLQTIARSEFSTESLNAADNIVTRVESAARACELIAEAASHNESAHALAGGLDERAAMLAPRGSGILAFAHLAADGAVVSVARTADCSAHIVFPERVAPPGEAPVQGHRLWSVGILTSPASTPRLTLAVAVRATPRRDGAILLAFLDPDPMFAPVIDASVSAGRQTMLRTHAGRVVASAQAPATSRDDDVIESSASVDIEIATEVEPWTVSVAIPRASILSNVVDLRRHTLVTLLAIGACGFLLALILARQITRPLRRLQAGADRIAHGDLAHELQAETRDEIGDVARSLRSMTHSLRSSLDQLEQERRTLASRVADRTEALRAQSDELARANDQLRSLDRLKSDFITNVSHELRTPLTMLSSTLEALDGPVPVPPHKQKHLLAIARDGSTRLGAILHQIIAYADVEAGPRTWIVETLDMRRLVESVVEDARAYALVGGLRLSAQYDPDVPLVDGAADKLTLALRNLLSNAIMYTPPGGSVDVLVEPRVVRGARMVRVSVRDTGCGIAREDIQRVFERFAQGGSILTDKPKGIGLGLPITRRVVEQLAGRVTVTSRVGKGSTFTIDLPASSATAIAHDQAA